MKKIIRFTLCTFCLLASTCYAQSFSSGNIESYLGKTYVHGGPGWIIQLKLNKDYSYESSEDSEGGWHYNSGTFEFTEGYIFLKPKVCKLTENSEGSVPCSETLGEVKIDLVETHDDLYFLEYLRVRSISANSYLDTHQMRFGVPGTEVPEGKSRIYKELNVVTMGMKKGKTTSDVKIRKGPDVKSEVISFQPEMFTDYSGTAVPLGFSVTVIARTSDKVQVKEWNNYWYLVNVGFHEEVWMYGEFVKFDE